MNYMWPGTTWTGSGPLKKCFLLSSKIKNVFISQMHKEYKQNQVGARGLVHFQVVSCGLVMLQDGWLVSSSLWSFK